MYDPLRLGWCLTSVLSTPKNQKATSEKSLGCSEDRTDHWNSECIWYFLCSKRFFFFFFLWIETDQCFSWPVFFFLNTLYFVSYDRIPLLSDTVIVRFHISRTNITTCFLAKLEKKQERKGNRSVANGQRAFISFWLLLCCQVLFWHELVRKLLVYAWWMAELSPSAHSRITSPQRRAQQLNSVCV